MKKSDAFFWELLSEIEKELKNIDDLKKELASVPENTAFSRRTKGSILHDFYNCCERIFRRISQNINGEISESEKWHKELLARMTRPVKNVRPAVISEELAAELDDYLGFRHLFRNIYGFELKGERLDRLVKKFSGVSGRFKKETRRFLKELTR